MGDHLDKQRTQNIVHFFYELGQLKRVKRSGWWVAGIADPESVAEHTLRTAHIGFVLATLEGADPYKTAMMCLFHDMHETRINDQHRLGKRYIDTDQAEEKVLEDQMSPLPSAISEPLHSLIGEYEERNSPESIIAKDADLLECALQAIEYRSQGNQNVEEWITNNIANLKTSSAKHIAQACLHTAPNEWWRRGFEQ